MEVISVVNQKGGVGKTTTCVNLAASLAVIGKKTLVIDFDPQGNASTGLGIEANERRQNIYGVLIKRYGLGDAIHKTNIKNLFIVPSTVDLAAAELELKEMPKREYILKEALANLKNVFDYVIIDCPPSLGLITVNALTAAEQLIIPMQCEFYSLEGLSHLIKTVKIIQDRLNPNLEIKGILLTMFDKRNRISEQVAREVRKHLKSKVFNTVIPRNVKMCEAPSFGKPAIAYDHTCSGAKSYIKLVKEILTNNQLQALHE